MQLYLILIYFYKQTRFSSAYSVLKLFRSGVVEVVTCQHTTRNSQDRLLETCRFSPKQPRFLPGVKHTQQMSIFEALVWLQLNVTVLQLVWTRLKHQHMQKTSCETWLHQAAVIWNILSASLIGQMHLHDFIKTKADQTFPSFRIFLIFILYLPFNRLTG